MEKDLWVRRYYQMPGSMWERLLIEFTVPDNTTLHGKVWMCEQHMPEFQMPGDRNLGGNIWFGETHPRLNDYVFSESDEFEIAWDPGKFQEGNCSYLHLDSQGDLPPVPYSVMEVDELAAMCPTDVRVAAQYPHWHHNEYVMTSHFYSHITSAVPICLFPVLKIIARSPDADGFLHPDTFLEGWSNELGFIGPFDHFDPSNTNVTFREGRKTLPDHSPNPEFRRADFFVPPDPPIGWEFG